MPDRKWFVLGGVVCALIVTSALAADVAIRGRRMAVRENPAGETGRRVVVVGRESTTSATFGEPLYGAYLRVFVDGGQGAQSQLFFLEPAGWSSVSGGYRYAGPGPDGSPIERVDVNVEPGKPARIRAVLRGDLGSDALNLLPPDPGTSGGLSLGTTGDTFCVVLGGAAGGTVVADDASAWRIRNATSEVACPPVPTPGPTPVHTPTPGPCDTLCNGTPTPVATSGSVTLRPIAAGTYTEWGESSPDVGSAHWQHVDEAVADEAATYVQDNTWSGVEKDTFLHEPSQLPSGATIDGVDVCIRVRQTDNDGTLEDNGVRILIRSSSGEAEHLAAAQLPRTWSTYCKTWPTDPTTSTPWTVASVDALEIGAQNAMSPGSTDGVRLTQVWMEVRYTP
jgi:hypothetical protein